MSSAARDVIASHRIQLCTPEAKHRLASEWDQYHSAYVALSQTLHAMKNSPAFEIHFNHLRDIQPLVTITVQRSRKLSGEMQQEREVRKAVMKQRNLSHTQWAMGNEGTIGMASDVEDSLEEAMEELNDDHVEMQEHEMDEAKWRWLEEDAYGRERVVDGRGHILPIRKRVQLDKGKGKQKEITGFGP